jgi:hypothetical protein
MSKKASREPHAPGSNAAVAKSTTALVSIAKNVAAPVTINKTLEKLKAQYFSIEASRTEGYRQQGRKLIEIKKELGHGNWESWMKKNLYLSPSQARLRMQVGFLSALPKSPANRSFTLANLAAIGEIAEKGNLTPREAANRLLEKRPKHKAPGDADENPSGEGDMTRLEAFKALGIDVENLTVTAESLRILRNGLRKSRHSDKGGKDEEFILVTAAVKVLSPSRTENRALSNPSGAESAAAGEAA